MADLDAVRAAQAARRRRLEPPPPVVAWYPARPPEPEPEPEEESIFGLNLAPPPVVCLPSSETSHQLAMRARRQRQAAADAAGGSMWSLVMSQLSDPTTTALLHELLAAAGIALADTSVGDHGPVPRAEFPPGDAPDDDTRRAREGWRRARAQQKVSVLLPAFLHSFETRILAGSRLLARWTTSCGSPLRRQMRSQRVARSKTGTVSYSSSTRGN